MPFEVIFRLQRQYPDHPAGQAHNCHDSCDKKASASLRIETFSSCWAPGPKECRQCFLHMCALHNKFLSINTLRSLAKDPATSHPGRRSPLTYHTKTIAVALISYAILSQYDHAGTPCTVSASPNQRHLSSIALLSSTYPLVCQFNSGQVCTSDHTTFANHYQRADTIAAFACSLSAYAPCIIWQEQRAVTMISITIVAHTQRSTNSVWQSAPPSRRGHQTR